MLIKIKNHIINPAHIAYVEPFGNTAIYIHFHGLPERQSLLTISFRTLKETEDALETIYNAGNSKGE